MDSFEGLPNWLSNRGAGVLLHPSSLPGKYGIGSLGKQAREWLDFLSDAGFSYWQMCPLGPTGFGDSPYQVFSSSAGNPYFIDLEVLLAHGYLVQEDLLPLNQFDPMSIIKDKLPEGSDTKDLINSLLPFNSSERYSKVFVSHFTSSLPIYILYISESDFRECAIKLNALASFVIAAVTISLSEPLFI